MTPIKLGLGPLGRITVVDDLVLHYRTIYVEFRDGGAMEHSIYFVYSELEKLLLYPDYLFLIV